MAAATAPNAISSDASRACRDLRGPATVDACASEQKCRAWQQLHDGCGWCGEGGGRQGRAKQVACHVRRCCWREASCGFCGIGAGSTAGPSGFSICIAALTGSAAALQIAWSRGRLSPAPKLLRIYHPRLERGVEMHCTAERCHLEIDHAVWLSLVTNTRLTLLALRAMTSPTVA